MSNKTVVSDFWASYAKGDLDATWAQFVDEDLVIHPTGGFAFTRQTWLDIEKSLIASFKDISVEVLDQVAEGDKVATRWVLTATQTQDFLGVTSTGRTATLNGTTVDVIRDGKIVEHWGEVGTDYFLGLLAGTR
ncbi:ester cyclase [Streptomyces sp. J2-1]|uniref:ester cyclase n=1 Tax=Streptomyces corallincola TaxID=2851888 RepID=UPI001C39261B|nr:ester cyclase [Streptomyces corallincola]MBV2353839.1 ester cyclase [Streptomyces corallincola]